MNGEGEGDPSMWLSARYPKTAFAVGVIGVVCGVIPAFDMPAVPYAGFGPMARIGVDTVMLSLCGILMCRCLMSRMPIVDAVSGRDLGGYCALSAMVMLCYAALAPTAWLIGRDIWVAFPVVTLNIVFSLTVTTMAMIAVALFGRVGCVVAMCAAGCALFTLPWQSRWLGFSLLPMDLGDHVLIRLAICALLGLCAVLGWHRSRLGAAPLLLG